MEISGEIMVANAPPSSTCDTHTTPKYGGRLSNGLSFNSYICQSMEIEMGIEIGFDPIAHMEASRVCRYNGCQSV